ncbi:MAG: hypothetical protein IPK01_00765 [Acidobacteria bacterium]|nr:hypothetical protein [Acidobacteriota bacterium]
MIIIIFTNADSIYWVPRGKEFLNKYSLPEPWCTNVMCHFAEEPARFDFVDRLEAHGLYFANDKIAVETFLEMIDGFKEEDLYLVKHTNPKFVNERFVKRVGSALRFVEGQHGTVGRIYNEVVEVMCDECPQKVERIIDIAFQLKSEAKRRFLSDCSDLSHSLPLGLPAAFEGIPNADEAYETFIREIARLRTLPGQLNCSSPEFLKAFELLRKTLAPS